jgi:hypothetical protein
MTTPTHLQLRQKEDQYEEDSCLHKDDIKQPTNEEKINLLNNTGKYLFQKVSSK